MKTKRYIIIGTIGVALAGAIFAGCKKDTTPTTTTSTPNDYTAAQDDNNGSSTANDAATISDGASSGQAIDRTLSFCSIIPRRDTTIASVTDSLLDINFGLTDCVCADGRTRRGHILVWYLGRNYFTQGGTIGIGFQNYYINDIGITGTITITNVGRDSAGLRTWSYSASLTLTYPNGGGTATWTSNRTYTLTKVSGVWYYVVTGSASGVGRKGVKYSIAISNTNPIYVTAFNFARGGCKYFEAGDITVTLPSYTISVVYGTAIGTCSNQAVATIDGKSYTFTQN